MPPRYLNLEELKRLHDSIPERKLRDRLIMYLMSRMGLRVGEVANLKVEDISMKTQTITIKRSARGKEETKGGGWRTLQIDSVVWQILTAYLEERRTGHLIRPRGDRYGEKPISTRAIHGLVRRYAARAGLNKSISPHWLRHSYAVQYLMEGGNLEDLRRSLGHSKLEVTQIYIECVGTIGKVPILRY